MLVLSRKKNESILIDGVVRIEVVSVSRSTVRVRLMAPRSLHVPLGTAKKDGRGREDSVPRAGPVGVEVRLMTLVNQQVVSLGEAISLGVVDADKSRALFFIDAPTGMSVEAVDPDHRVPSAASSRQNLLQFMGPGGERSDENREKPEPTIEPKSSPPTGDEAGPDLLPFPSPLTRRRRI
jgi:sRNA-binding carbon storage regulator CsrA